MTRKANPEARPSILAAAHKLFLQHGYHGVSVDDIAKAVGMKKANIFHYYPTKEELAFAVLCHAAEESKSRFFAECKGKKDPKRFVRALFETRIRWMQSEDGASGSLIANFAQEVSGFNEKLREKIAASMQSWIDEISTMFAEAKAAGKFGRTFQPEQAARAVLSMLEGAVLIAKAEKNVSALRCAANAAIKLVSN
jgi:TetR/AcrR family transcriptional regulator, transcriptional repressor for nem operon